MLSLVAVALLSQTPLQPYVLPDGTIPSHVTVLPGVMQLQSPSQPGSRRPLSPQSAAADDDARTASRSDAESLVQQASHVVTASDAAASASGGESPFFTRPGQPVFQPVGNPIVRPVQYQQPGAYPQTAYPQAPIPDPNFPAPIFDPRGQNGFGYGEFRPDRPRILPRPDVVGQGRFALELGYQGNFYGDGRIDDPFAPEDIDDFTEHIGRGLLRAGLTDTLELRLGGDLSVVDVAFENIPDAEFDTGGVDIGLKWKLAEQVGISPEFAVLGEAGYFEADGEGTGRGRILGLAEWELGYGFALGVSGGVLLTGETALNDSGTEGTLSISLEKRIGRAAIFGELAGVTNSRAYAQAGLLVPLGDSVFFDIHGGYAGYTEDVRNNSGGLSEVNLDGGFVGAGFTIYTP